MKPYALLFVLVYVICQDAAAQRQVSSVPASGAVPAAYKISNINYIRTWEPSFPSVSPTEVSDPAKNVREVKQATQYFDGLGHLLQMVSKGTGGGRDVVKPFVYDAFGREQYKYLPYVPTAGNMSDGKLKMDPFNGQQLFYQDKEFNPSLSGESIYYGETEYEASPLNRTINIFSPGNSWAKSKGARAVKQQYLTNNTSDSVRIWRMAPSDEYPTTQAVYNAGELEKVVVIDEQGRQAIKFNDKEGRLVLKKAQLDAVAGVGHMSWLCTYYIYDDMGSLRIIIPPSGVSKITSSWNISAIAEEFCFQYRYDKRKRPVVRKVPGAKPVEMVYDLRDRLVFTRDGNLKATGNWLVSFYDSSDRLVESALYKFSDSMEALQMAMDNAPIVTGTTRYEFPGVADLVVAVNDRSTYTASNSITLESGFDTGPNSVADMYIDPQLKNGVADISVYNPLPNLDPALLQPVTYTFYDEYSFPGSHQAVIGELAEPQAGNNTNSEASIITTNTKGLVTGTKVRIVGTDQWLTTTTYYNEKGRTVQIIADNMTGGTDVTSNLFDFNGKLLSTYLHHKNPISGTNPETRFLTMVDYDEVGRIAVIRKRVGNDGILKEIARMEYDALGQLKKKILGGGIDELSYDYNIRSWLLGVNRNFVKSASDGNYFGFELAYDNPVSIIPQTSFANPQYNTTVAGLSWRARGDNIARKYDFTYDPTKRLIAADFNQQNTGSVLWSKNLVNFSVDNISYDKNGNILTMKQWGVAGNTPAIIDNLKYDYKNGTTNKLNFVTDESNNPQSTLGDFKEITKDSNQDYWYDDNGNLIKDNNKGITSITYNHLNLPELVTVAGKGSIRFYYDAGGRKWRKVVKDNTTGSAKEIVTDYTGSFEYRDNKLQQIGHEEGRIRTVEKPGAPVEYVYDYFERDHLGNIRVVLTEQSATSLYTATMETESALKETAIFSNVDNTRSPKPVGYPDSQSTGNKSVAKLNAQATGKKIGPSLVLKVMAGDSVRIGVNAFYKSGQPLNNKAGTPLSENMLTDLVAAFGGQRSGELHHGNSADIVQTPFNTNFYNNDYQKLKEKDNDAAHPDKPKAYLNFILFDDQFNLVEQNSGVKQVKAEPDQLQTLAQDAMPITKNGFLYVYVSNETQQDVFFDNMVVAHTAGRILEETHYYPYGLTMAGISSAAVKGQENKHRFNGKVLNNKEFSDGGGLDWYDYGMREYDPQIGRFFRLDPISMDFPYLSPYQYAGNDPIMNVDLDGLEPENAIESYDLSKARTHTYPSGQKAFLLDNSWVSMRRGEYGDVYFYSKDGSPWKEFVPKFREDINKSRAEGLISVSNNFALGMSTILFAGASGITGGIQSASWVGGGMAVGDVAAQMVTNESQNTFSGRLMDVNWTSPISGMFLKNPVAAAVAASALDFRLSNVKKGDIARGFDGSFVFGEKNAKTFLIESAAFGIAGTAAGEGAGFLRLGSKGGAAALNGALKRSGAITIDFGAASLTATQMNSVWQIIQIALYDQSKDVKNKKKKK
ncbi:RHS repeat-associated core domain-containing protein [Chitinophaga oryzae]|uniref:RHS repeat-associated core domain-containing protein n=1 Tax=Chitinophaga oryzae TaxID=2725414 RepID=A0ABX6LG04_9BACT|nr:DUF6443 domain-containing protein [Chitinophaga oryzae]QJB38982.1 RHS repeat-associated core domain-containing protein [Chitinophaga oryzae]